VTWIRKWWKWLAGGVAALVGAVLYLVLRRDPTPQSFKDKAAGTTKKKVDEATEEVSDEIEDSRNRVLDRNPFRMRSDK
jgi:hypothetical protein